MIWTAMFCVVVAIVAYQLGHLRGWLARGKLEAEIRDKERELQIKKIEFATKQEARKQQVRTQPWDCEPR